MNGYLVVEASSASHLEEKVQEMRQRGYEPQGGVSVTVTKWQRSGATGDWCAARKLYAQAMTRYDEDADWTMDPDEMEALLRESTVTGVPV